ncbi:MAG: diadenylate cyclase CdaA [Candidatus Edwardsbacteria bacterium]|jgi:diadenylate cyclase|nr:diadenylate cyclase CdaA [Candidatus Edwardsbacteria bacterium]
MMFQQVLKPFALPGVLSFITVRPLDILDIVLVAYILYRVLHLMKGTRAIQMLFGIAALVAFGIAARVYDLPGTGWFVTSIGSVWVVAFVILFQPEIRNWLTQLGRNRFFGLFLKGEGRAIGVVVQACQQLIARGYGAIIVFEKNDGLKNHTDTGVAIGARVSEQLLVSLFVPESPMHDGAVVVRGDQIIAAGCTLPMTQDQTVSARYGMRHRAGVGLTEETDAVAVIVSEERGAVAIARYGRLAALSGPAELREKLSKALHAKAGGDADPAQLSVFQ